MSCFNSLREPPATDEYAPAEFTAQVETDFDLSPASVTMRRRRASWCCPPSGIMSVPPDEDEIQGGSVAAVSEERRPDTQAELANERTYLAWLRMGLALVAVGVAAEQVLPAQGIIWARQLIGVTLILSGVLTAGLARWRWQTVNRALRAGRPIPGPILGYVVAAAIVLNGIATIVLLLRADAG
jgi:putative membrane protein